MSDFSMQDLQIHDLPKARQLEQQLETLIVDDLIVARAHGFQLPEEIAHLDNYLEQLKRVRISIAVSQEIEGEG